MIICAAYLSCLDARPSSEASSLLRSTDLVQLPIDIMYTYICVYIYIYREREIDRYTHMCVYMYIYICTHILYIAV